jgi:Yip1-like protein
MIRALLLIFGPGSTWDNIFRARRSLGFVFLTYLVPMLLLTSIVEGYGLHHWGKARELGWRKSYMPGEAFLFELAQSLLFVVVVFVAAKLLKSVGETFHSRNTFAQAFATVTYGLGPLFLLHLLDGLKDLSPWLPWAVGILLSIAVLYQGVPRMMEPDPAHAFGLYLTTSLLLLLSTGLVRLATACYLQGKFSQLEAGLAHLGARWPFQ